MAGPYVYLNPRSLVGKPYVADIAGNHRGECVSLLKHYINELKNKRTTTWIEGPNVIETLEKGGTILEGTAIATFVNGRFPLPTPKEPDAHGHAAFFAGYVRNKDGEIFISIVDQYLGKWPSGAIQERPLKNSGKDPDGNWSDRSNNGRAFSVIL
jgi:hypothetical protein